MSRLIVYAGPNGAGKSTLRDIGDDPVEVVIDPDRIAREIAPFAPDCAPDPPQWFQSRWPEIQLALATHTGGAL